MDDTKYDFSVVNRAGLTQQEFAQLIGVGRLTVHFWMKGKRKPSRYLAKKVRKALALLAKAVDENKLPGAMPPPVRGAMVQRVAYIRAAL